MKRQKFALPRLDAVVPPLFDGPELEILRRFLGLPAGDSAAAARVEPAHDQELDSIHDRDDLRVTPVRLPIGPRHNSDFPRRDFGVCASVGQLCIDAVQQRLTDWYLPPGATERICFPSPLAQLLQPRLICSINWADSGPGCSWPESYGLTYLHPFRRFVVTATPDQEVWGYSRLAIGAFPRGAAIVGSCRAILEGWWRHQHELGHEEGWTHFLGSGLLTAKVACDVRRNVWGGPGYTGPLVIDGSVKPRRPVKPVPPPNPPAPKLPTAKDGPYSAFEGRVFKCERCGAAGTYHQRTFQASSWPPWYAEWAIPAASGAAAYSTFESRIVPASLARCPPCRRPAAIGDQEAP
jgi:hypothetical protein